MEVITKRDKHDGTTISRSINRSAKVDRGREREKMECWIINWAQFAEIKELPVLID